MSQILSVQLSEGKRREAGRSEQTTVAAPVAKRAVRAMGGEPERNPPMNESEKKTVAEAAQTLAALKAGVRDFPGIGLPPDLAGRP